MTATKPLLRLPEHALDLNYLGRAASRSAHSPASQTGHLYFKQVGDISTLG